MPLSGHVRFCKKRIRYVHVYMHNAAAALDQNIPLQNILRFLNQTLIRKFVPYSFIVHVHLSVLTVHLRLFSSCV